MAVAEGLVRDPALGAGSSLDDALGGFVRSVRLFGERRCVSPTWKFDESKHFVGLSCADAAPIEVSNPCSLLQESLHVRTVADTASAERVPVARGARVSTSSSRPPAAVEKAVGRGQTKSSAACPWVTSGPVGQRLGRLQRAQGRRVRARLPGPRTGQGGDPRPPAAPRSVPESTASCRTAGSNRSWCRSRRPICRRSSRTGRSFRKRFAQKMAAHAGRFDPDEADWIAGRLGLETKSLGTISDMAGGSLVSFPVLGETDRSAAEPRSVRQRRRPGSRRCRRTAASSFRNSPAARPPTGSAKRWPSPKARRPPATSTCRPRSSACSSR